ncbi:uncharacterized protein A4U43_C01F12860 [Asparagus officinalis]|uniref:Uncharacterized protein n=1 Tax=Asparagus officinalis TaxID=4686 RepID=A0A5P1FNX8_ASPOF|nr:uncharacterized protein A4U43_C01F12860 [Asparagus officinalis]
MGRAADGGDGGSEEGEGDGGFGEGGEGGSGGGAEGAWPAVGGGGMVGGGVQRGGMRARRSVAAPSRQEGGGGGGSIVRDGAEGGGHNSFKTASGTMITELIDMQISSLGHSDADLQLSDVNLESAKHFMDESALLDDGELQYSDKSSDALEDHVPNKSFL